MNIWRKISIVLTILLAIEIFYISSLSTFPTESPIGLNIVPIAYHFIVFFLFSFFLFVSISKIEITTKFWVSLENERTELIMRAILVMGLGAFYAIMDELHQLFIPGRICSFGDVMLDFAGICFGVTIYLLIVIKNGGP